MRAIQICDWYRSWIFFPMLPSSDGYSKAVGGGSLYIILAHDFCSHGSSLHIWLSSTPLIQDDAFLFLILSYFLLFHGCSTPLHFLLFRPHKVNIRWSLKYERRNRWNYFSEHLIKNQQRGWAVRPNGSWYKHVASILLFSIAFGHSI